MELQPEWVIAIATIVMVIVVGLGFWTNQKILNEMKVNRKASTLPLLEFGSTWDQHHSSFVVKNIGNGLAKNIHLQVEFEVYKGINNSNEKLDLPAGKRALYGIDPIPVYMLEHRQTIIAKIKFEFQDVFGEKFSGDQEQNLLKTI